MLDFVQTYHKAVNAKCIKDIIEIEHHIVKFSDFCSKILFKDAV